MPEPAPSAADRFRGFFEAHYPRVRSYAERRCAHAADVDDAVAETFVVAWRRFDAIPADAELPWLYGVARRVVSNQRRSRRRWLGLLDRMRSQPGDVPTPPDAGNPALEALASLRPEDQELLRLVAWEGLSHAQIAAVLGVSANAVGIRVHRARKRLAEALASSQDDARNEAAAAGHSHG